MFSVGPQCHRNRDNTLLDLLSSTPLRHESFYQLYSPPNIMPVIKFIEHLKRVH